MTVVLASGEGHVDSTRLFGAVVCLFLCGEVTESSLSSVNVRHSNPRFMTMRPVASFVNPPKPAGALFGQSVLSVLRSGDHEKIGASIVQSLSVSVIDLSSVSGFQSHQESVQSNGPLRTIGNILSVPIFIQVPRMGTDKVLILLVNREVFSTRSSQLNPHADQRISSGGWTTSQ